MEKTKEALLAFVAEKTKKRWDEHGLPYFMSAISPDLRLDGIQYREIIGTDVTLTKFLMENSGDKFKVVFHPRVKEKIALVPSSEPFEFEGAPTPIARESGSAAHSRRTFKNKKALYEFLRAVSELRDLDVDKINIPTSVLIKLLIDQ